ncbi:MAG: DUF333 domain-containing protein [candidate division SR1 bacterium]|nr:DUF333 domain-containing protein [candidate division SR1 bacterium]
MKKLLRKLILLIILVCIFVLIKKHSNQFAITTPTGSGTIQTGTVTTGLDLTNCVSYFDGCNHCSVKDGKADACTLMYCEKPTEPKCLQYATGTATTPTTETTTGTTSLANPASVNCEKKGGTLEIVTAADGGQSGICTLSDGSKCEERAFFRGECGTGTTK